MTKSPVRYRAMRKEDVPELIRLEAASFPGIPPERHWIPAMLEAHVDKFPEGQFVAEIDGRLVGSATTLLVPLAAALTPHKWREITGGGYLTTHDPSGDALYGTEVMVHPDARRRGIGRHLYELRKDLIRRRNLRAFVTGGRIPEYVKHAGEMSASAYVRSVLRGERTDRTLTPQLRSGMTVAGVMPAYITDPNSRNWATLLVWWNLDYEAPTSLTPAAPSARAGDSATAKAQRAGHDR
ncbi:MAG TPA: GNAT family N-acetyltransferase [Candidatus Thermoplasmatota archaeon]|nr:GNAT family N-acetyltransferase [Candidatus Thermoplasmatota archaeon]